MESDDQAFLSGEKTPGKGLIVGAFIGKRLADNLAAFKRYLPDIYDAFCEYQEKRYFLIYDDYGNINIFDSEDKKTLFSGNPVQQCIDTLEAYKKSPIQRPYFISHTAGEDEAVQDADSNLVNYIHSPFLNRIAGEQAGLLKKLAKDVRDRIVSRLSGADDMGGGQKNEALPSHVNMMIFLSTGVGFDFESLYLNHEIQRLVLLEPDFDIFYASLQLIDWVSIVEKSIRNNYQLDIIVNDDIETISDSLSGAVSRLGRHHMSGAFVYSGFYLEQYHDLFVKIKGDIQYGHLSGFGFYDDSRYNLAHTLGNIKNNIPFLCSNKSINKSFGQKDIPVFVVGNGPSLDDDLDFLRINQCDAIIVSCGSSLRTLIKNDIIPDMHAELERTAHVPYWIKNSAVGIDDFFEKIKKITFVAASQVHPDAFDLFESSGQLLKDTETGSMLAHYALKGSGVPLVPRVAPSCVHIAVTASVLLGFRKIYFFGADMGSIDPESHHSKDSLYYNLDEKDQKARVFSKKGEIFESNFGEQEVYSSGIYPLFKRELEVIIKGWRHNFQDHISFYNCSNGARIDGAEALRSVDIELSECKEKREVFNSSFSSLFSYYPADNYDDVMAMADVAVDYVSKACDWAIERIGAVGSIEEAVNTVDIFAQEFHGSDVLPDDYAWVYSVFDGSLLYALSVMNTTIQLPVQEKDAVEAFNMQLQHLRSFFEIVKNDFRENYLVWDKESRYSMFG